MQTTMVFAWMLAKDFVGQYYGPGLDVSDIAEADQNNYRTVAFGALEALSTDSLTIMRKNHLSNPALSISAYFNVTYNDGLITTTPQSNDFMYLNGTKTDWPPEAEIYSPSIYNLVNVAVHTVNLDLGSAGANNIYRNFAVVNKTISPNLAPANITPPNWAEDSQSFYYGQIPRPYQTWAQMLLARQTIRLGNVTGLLGDPNMVTTYLCPTYQRKQILSLLAAIFVGTSSMLLSGWGGWKAATAFWATHIAEPCEWLYVLEVLWKLILRFRRREVCLRYAHARVAS